MITKHCHFLRCVCGSHRMKKVCLVRRHIAVALRAVESFGPRLPGSPVTGFGMVRIPLCQVFFSKPRRQPLME